MSGFEIIASVVSGIAIPLFQSSDCLLREFSKETKQTIFKASRAYEKRYIERHGNVKVLGMREPIPLDSIYTKVQFLDDYGIKLYESIESLEEAFRYSKEVFDERSLWRSIFRDGKSAKRDGLGVANEKPFLMVLGGPGAGKSTFLRRMGLAAIKGGYQHKKIPVLLELKSFGDSDFSILKAISKEFCICGFPKYSEFTQTALERGELLILLDGLDEVSPTYRNETTRRIQNFVDQYRSNRFIISCRTAAYRHNLRQFTDVSMAEFDNEQIKKFISNWFRSKPDAGSACWEKINSFTHKAAKELAQTPLLLTLLCLLYQKAGQFPYNRATLYEKALRVLLEEWAGEKGLIHESTYKGIDTRLKETLLSEIAYHSFTKDNLFISRRDLSSQIEDFLGDILVDELSIDGDLVLKDIEAQHGVLVERVEGVYSFSHLTLQEYLVAQYIDDHRDDEEPTIQKLVSHKITDERWREVFLLVSGLMRGGADRLLISMCQKTEHLGRGVPKIRKLIIWSSYVTQGSASTLSSSVKRAIALYLVCTLARNGVRNRIQKSLGLEQACDIARDIARDISLYLSRDTVMILSHVRELNLSLDDAKIFNDNACLEDVTNRITNLKSKFLEAKYPLGDRRKFSLWVHQIWLHSLALPFSALDFSEEEIKSLIAYLNANLLILQCQESAVRTSSETKMKISRELLKLRSH